MRREAYDHNRAILPLIEQIIMLVVFALCAAICVRIFAYSHALSIKNEARDKAVIAVQSAAEVTVFSKGDYEKIAELLAAQYSSDGVFCYYDKDFNPCEEKDEAYRLIIKNTDNEDKIGHAYACIIDLSGNEVFGVRCSFQEGIF